MNTRILYSPSHVAKVLSHLPTLQSLLPSPFEEGSSSVAFPGVLRTTNRELYRWIANTASYPHLVEPVRQLEEVNAAGCRFDQLLRTTNREQFVGTTAELLVAHDLLRRGYSVTPISRTDQATPDLRVIADGLTLAVEVYNPRELLAIDARTHEVGDLLQYIDVRSSFRSRVSTQIVRPIPSVPWQLDPWAPDKMLQQTRRRVIEQIAGDVERATSEIRPLNAAYRHEGTPMLTTVELENVEMAREAGPVREGTISMPGFSGYSPAGVFRTIVERALRKARARQTQRVAADARILVVYLMGSKIAEDLAHPAHMREAEAVLAGVDPTAYGLDAIAFVARVLPTGLGMIFTIADDATLTPEQVEALFKQSPSAAERG